MNRSTGNRGRLWSAAFVGTRLALLAAIFYLSLHHWMREGYWEFAGIWHYGLPLLDPRVPATLIDAFLSAVFWNWVALPIALWFAARVPPDVRGKKLIAGVLALGLGTRGVVGPLIVRAAVGAPLVLSPAGAPAAASLLEQPYAARWLVLLTQLWWVLPLLIAALWLVGAGTARRPRVIWAVRGLLAAYALCRPIDASYLLTAGGPRGATQTLTLIAFQEGFGRQEFGYASVLTFLLCFALLPPAWLLRAGVADLTPAELPRPSGVRIGSGRIGWVGLSLLVLLPLVTAGLRLPAPLALPPAVWSAAFVSLLLAAVGGVWSGFLSGMLSTSPQSDSGTKAEVVKYWVLLFPPLALVLPMIRPWGYHTGLVEAGVLFVGMVALTPHLALGVLTARLQLARGVTLPVARQSVAWVTAWAIWTELGVDVMLSQSRHPWLPLQGGLVWELSTVLRASPLAVPGWPLAWAGGTFLAWSALCRLFRTPSLPGSLSDPEGSPDLESAP